MGVLSIAGALTLLLSYLIGSIPTAYILVKLVKGIDIRTLGSGNVGATNAGRAVGRWGFVVVLLIDALKGFVPVFITIRLAAVHGLSSNLALVAAAGVILGHTFTIFLKFRGGKGVATGLGVFLALALPAVLIALGVFILAVLAFRMISLGSILAAIVLTASTVFLYSWRALWLFTAIMAVFIIIKHRQNISRILSGTENKVGAKAKS